MTDLPQTLNDNSDGIRYITKICKMCGEEFECPSTWRRTQWCDLCMALRKDYRKLGHEISARMAKRSFAEKKPCEDCGDRGEIYHHIVPLSKGGGVGPHNLKFLCRPCHTHYHEAKE